jgi:ABC-type transport system substrate-binding protein
VIEGKHGGTLNLAARENIAHQDVHQEASPALSTWGPGIVYSRLLRFQSGPELDLPSLAVECELCEGWGMSETGTEFRFRLRDGVRWQNIPPVNGRALTSDDIAFSYERQRQDGWPNAPLLHMVEEIAAPQPNILRIYLLAPDADFFASLADGRSKIVARDAVQVQGDLKGGPTIGSGPWILTETRSDVSHTFESNPDYFERPYPFVDKLKIHVITDAETRDAAFRVGALDVQQMEPQEWEKYRQQEPGTPFMRVRAPGTGLEVALNTSVSPFDDARIRRAVFQAMDPWQAVEEVWLGAAFVSLGMPPAEADWLLAEPDLRDYFGDADLARELLSNSSLDLPLSVSIKVGDFGEPYRAHASRIADEMRAIGFAPTLQLMNRRQFGDEVWLGGDYQMFVGPIAPQTTANGYLLPVLHSLGRWNTTGHQDEELDAMILAQAQEADALARKALLLRIQRHALGNAYRFVPASRVSIWTWWPRVQGFHPNFAGSEYFHWARVWVSD